MQTIIELIDATVVSQWFVRALIANHPGWFEQPGPKSVQWNSGQERQNKRQPQTEMHSFKDAVIPIPQCPGIKLLQRLAQQVNTLFVTRKLANVGDRLSKHFANTPRTRRRFGRVLGHILDHSPQIQTRTPIDVAKIAKHHVRLVTATKPIIARKSALPRPTHEVLDQFATAITASRQQLLWKTVPTIQARFLATRARMLAGRGRLQSVMGVPNARIDQGGKQSSQRMQIHRVPSRRLDEQLVQHGPQLNAFRHVHAHVECLHLIVPSIPNLPLGGKGGIPLAHQIFEEFKELLLFRLLAVHASIWRHRTVGIHNQRRLGHDARTNQNISKPPA